MSVRNRVSDAERFAAGDPWNTPAADHLCLGPRRIESGKAWHGRRSAPKASAGRALHAHKTLCAEYHASGLNELGHCDLPGSCGPAQPAVAVVGSFECGSIIILYKCRSSRLTHVLFPM
jgi:hypothetical protein